MIEEKHLTNKKTSFKLNSLSGKNQVKWISFLEGGQERSKPRRHTCDYVLCPVLSSAFASIHSLIHGILLFQTERINSRKSTHSFYLSKKHINLEVYGFKTLNLP